VFVYAEQRPPCAFTDKTFGDSCWTRTAAPHAARTMQFLDATQYIDYHMVPINLAARSIPALTNLPGQLQVWFFGLLRDGFATQTPRPTTTTCPRPRVYLYLICLHLVLIPKHVVVGVLPDMYFLTLTFFGSTSTLFLSAGCYTCYRHGAMAFHLPHLTLPVNVPFFMPTTCACALAITAIPPIRLILRVTNLRHDASSPPVTAVRSRNAHALWIPFPATAYISSFRQPAFGDLRLPPLFNGWWFAYHAET